MLRVVTRTLAKSKTREQSVRKHEKREIFGSCLAVVSPVHMLSLSFAKKKKVTLIHNRFFSPTEQIDISEVFEVFPYFFD